MRPINVIAAVACAWMAAAAGAFAQDAATYPSEPIRIVVPFSAGGATDITARVMATEISKAINGTVVVENLAGSSGIPAMRAAAMSESARSPRWSTRLRANLSTASSFAAGAAAPRALSMSPALNPNRDPMKVCALRQ